MKLIFLTTLFICLQFTSLPQSLWHIDPPAEEIYQIIGEDTSLTKLKELILSDETPSYVYEYAAKIIALKYPDTEKDFLIQNLNTQVDTAETDIYSEQWNKYYTDMEILGYLGVTNAIEGMNKVANYAPDSTAQLYAIRKLAEAGIYTYFDKLMTMFQEGDTLTKEIAITALGNYFEDETYKNGLIQLYETIVRSDNFGILENLCINQMEYYDTPKLVEILESRFNETYDETKFQYFEKLNRINSINQPKRSKQAIFSERDENFIIKYIPDYFDIKFGSFGNEYLKPDWIETLSKIKEDNFTLLVRNKADKFLEKFKPANLSINSSVTDMIDSLIGLIDVMHDYLWIGDDAFIAELKIELQSARTNLQNGDSVACATNIKSFQDTVDAVYKDSLNSGPRFVTLEGWKFLYWNAQYILDRLPEIPLESNISTYSLFATHSLWLKENSDILSGDIGVNEAGSAPFLDSQIELSIGMGTTSPSGYNIKANRIKVKQGSTINGDVYYNELDNNGTIAGSQNTPLELPLFTALPEFKSSTPGTNDILIPQNGEQTLQPGSYGDIQVKKGGKLIFTGGDYHINSFNGGDNNQIVFQSPAQVRIADKFDSGQGSYLGPEDTTTVSAKDIIFYVGGINGNNGNLGATPKAAKIGISNVIKANFYVPNGTLWIREHSEIEGSFIAKDIEFGIGAKVKLSSAF